MFRCRLFPGHTFFRQMPDSEVSEMGKLNVKNGTPVGIEHRCKSCSWGQYTTGYRESEVMVFCTNTSPNFRVLFPIHECSEYYDRHRPGYEEMKKLAIDIQPVRVSKKTRGFGVGSVLGPEKPEYEPAIASKNGDDSDDTDAVSEEELEDEFENVEAVAERNLAP
jgi:hypothetical protein